jgi:manganese/zinc/iron transport system permease protein
LLLTFIQKIPSSSQAGLDKFIFGQAAALLLEDIVFMTVIGFGIMAILLIFWKEFKIMTFNPEYAEALGFSRTRIDLIMTVMIVTVIIVGLQTAGVILMSALLIAPAASARQWTDRLGPMVVVSSLIGAVSGICGALLSSAIQKMPTGPAITVVLTLIFLFSILFGPRRGILSRMIRFQENRKNFAVQGLIVDLYQLAVEHESLFHEHSIETLKAIRPAGENIRQGLKALEISGYAIHREGRLWSLTGDGIKKAQEIIRGEEDGN